MMVELRRHDLVWLAPDAELTVLDPANRHLARLWVEKGYPMVVARQSPEVEREGNLAVGFTLPPPLTRYRVAVVTPLDGVIRHRAPLGLEEAVDVCPEWREAAATLVALCKEAGATPFVYGSMSWQRITGHRYLTDRSDLDVLFVCSPATELQRLVESLVALDGSVRRVDGEILAPTGWATAWRELAAAGEPEQKLLAKSLREVRLMTVREFLDWENETMEAR
jgi:phosphoribosyl-dephospho-CoA transferase